MQGSRAAGQFMLEAIQLATANVLSGRGGPFGAIIVRDGIMVSSGTNLVTATHDPTAHAEMVAIRDACRTLATHELTNCEMYSSCEPCPMCLGAIYWARIPMVYYGNTREDAARIGFDDALFYRELALARDQRKVAMIPLMREQAQESFRAWERSPSKIPY